MPPSYNLIYLPSLWASMYPRKVMKAVVTLLRLWGVRIIIYIDDILIMSESLQH